MKFDLFLLPAVLLVGITALTLILSNNWRWSLAALYLLYVGVLILVAITWPVMMSLAKLLAGWIATTVLWMALSGQEQLRPLIDIEQEKQGSTEISYSVSSRLFRFFTSSLVILVVYSLIPLVGEWIPGLHRDQAVASLLLIGLGLLHLGLTAVPWRVVVGLLTMLAGFEIIYSAVEFSVLVEGLLAAVNLGLALLGVYMITMSGREEMA